MIIENSKIILFSLVAIISFLLQMYRDKLQTINLKINLENSALFGILTLILLSLHDNIRNSIENIDNMDTSNDNMDTSNDNMDTSNDNMDTSNDNMNTSNDNMDTSDDNMDTSTDNMDTSTDNMNTSTSMNTDTVKTSAEVLNKPMEIRPTGQPSTIQDVEIDRSTNKPPPINIHIENDDGEDIDMELDTSNTMNTLQSNVKKHLNQLIDKSDKKDSEKYIISDPKYWVHENEYKKNIIPNCQVCPVSLMNNYYMEI